MRQTRLLGLALGCCGSILLLAGCERASRYPANPKFVVASPNVEGKKNRPSVRPEFGYLKTEVADKDIPLVFVHASQTKEWEELREFWTQVPSPVVGMRTLHLGQPPLGAVAALVAGDTLDRSRVIKIRVPLGLPDPTPLIPEANPMTYRRWRLGKQLFFDRGWLTAEGNRSCASCHDPAAGFAEHAPPREAPWMNVPSLINCVYNKHQFWDGRAKHLEQVLQRQLEEEAAPTEPDRAGAAPADPHSWGGIVLRLSQRPDLIQGYVKAFDIDEPTVDATAKALAVYLRTLLSGDSLYDQASRNAAKKGISTLAAEHFETTLLTDQVLQALGREGPKGTEKEQAQHKKKVAAELANGCEVFFAKETRCTVCHTGKIFTDNSFHNISIRESAELQEPGKETGRFRQLPYGLKNPRMMGAFKTPSLRNLPQKARYFHDGYCGNLEEVVKHYNKAILNRYNKHLDPVLKDGPDKVWQINLSAKEADALILFLRSLDGAPVPSVVTAPPRHD